MFIIRKDATSLPEAWECYKGQTVVQVQSHDNGAIVARAADGTHLYLHRDEVTQKFED